MRKKKIDDAIRRAILPLLIKLLVDKGRISKSHLSEPSKLFQLFKRNLTFACNNFEMIISYHEDFAKEAAEAWRKGKREVAIVLYCTSIEQLLNLHYRLAFLAHGLSNEEVTKIIRTQSLDNKLTWLMQLASRKTLPKPLVGRFRKAIEIRNSLVHYKAIPGRVDTEDDSASVIGKRIGQLKRMSIQRDIDRLDEFVWKTLAGQDERFATAMEATNKIIDHIERQKRSGGDATKTP